MLCVHDLSRRAQMLISKIIEDVDQRFLPDPTEALERIVEQVAGTLLQEPPGELEPFVTRTSHEYETNTGHEAEVFEDDHEGVIQEEFVTEAEYGAGYEGGVDDDAREDMD
jgi:hypothetical protein